MKLITPIKDYKHALYPEGDVTQWFGENPTLYANMGMKGHNGIDVISPHGEPLRALEDGTVLDVKEDPKGYGKHIRFISKAADTDGYFREWTYGHNSQNLVAIGDEITAGQVIALMGNTGFVVSGATPFWKNNPYAGTHLHLGLRKVKRMKKGGWSYPGSDILIQVLNYNNGYKGSIDPTPFLLYAEELLEPSTTRNLQMTVIALLRTLLNLLKQKHDIK